MSQANNQLFIDTQEALMNDFKGEMMRLKTQFDALFEFFGRKMDQIPEKITNQEKIKNLFGDNEDDDEANDGQPNNVILDNKEVKIEQVEENVIGVTKKTRKPRKKKINPAIDTLKDLEDNTSLKPYKTGELRAFLTLKNLNTEGKKPILMERVFKAIMNPDELSELDKKVKEKKKRGKKKKVVEALPEVEPEVNEEVVEKNDNETVLIDDYVSQEAQLLNEHESDEETEDSNEIDF